MFEDVTGEDEIGVGKGKECLNTSPALPLFSPCSKYCLYHNFSKFLLP